MFISLLFLYLYENLLTSPYIRLERVIVDGVDGKLKHALLKMSELKPDTSLLSVRLDELKQRIEEHPWILRDTPQEVIPLGVPSDRVLAADKKDSA